MEVISALLMITDHGGAAELGQVGQGLDAGKAGHAFGLERDAELVAAERGGDALEAAEVVEHRRRGLVLRDERSDGVTGGHVHGDVRMCVGSGDGWRIDGRPGPPAWLAIFEFGAHQRGRRRFTEVLINY
jgi:hypothetical protein